MIDPTALAHRFEHHPPRDDDTIARHAAIRAACHDAARVVVDLTPPSREQSLAVTALEEAMMWANAAIARA